MQCKAKEFAIGIDDFAASPSLLRGWESRYNVSFRLTFGEAASSDVSAAKSLIEGTLASIIRLYRPEDVFNADETALFFRTIGRVLSRSPVMLCLESKLTSSVRLYLSYVIWLGEKNMPL